MAAMLVDASTGVMKQLLSKLSELLEGEYVKLKGVRKKIKFLRDELSTMNATLQMLAHAEELNPQMRDWRDKVRELAYDIEDCVDSFMVHVDQESHGSKRFKKLICKLKRLKHRHVIATEIDELMMRATEASDRHKRYNFTESASNSSTFAIDPRLPALYEEVDKLVGIDEQKDHIIEWFNKHTDDKNLKVLSIVGAGGLGKTTLANQVSSQVKHQFKCSAFVSVSRNPSIKKILRQILFEVGINPDTLDDDRQLIDKIKEYIKDKRYLVVIDDVWDVEVWKCLRLALFNNICGSRIITTTRNAVVASCSARDGGYVYQMEALSFTDSKRLFCKRAFGSEELCYPHLEKVFYGILEKCDGLPLAIITLSSLLVDQSSEHEWNRVLTAIGRALAKDPDAGNMTKILSLSYFDLPQNLQTCFLYLGAFPEDYSIGKQRLISRWIGEGFIRAEQGRSAYETGERYFNDLINRSLMQPVDVKYGEAQACRVHDIILDFIVCRATEENFVTLLDAADENGHISDYKVRRLSVQSHNKNKVTVPSSIIVSQARSLAIFGPAIQTSLLPFTALRVLDLKDCEDLENHHLVNIEKLFYLKYLCLGSKLITNLPEKTGEMQHLETLDIRGTKIEELPSTITKLQRLARLYVDVRTRFQNGMIGKMQNLEELQEFGLGYYEAGTSLQEFSKLTKLRRLKLRWLYALPSDSEGRSQAEDLQTYMAALISSCNLHHLYIMGYMTSFHPVSLESWRLPASCSLQKLHICFCFIDKVPDWMGSLENLTELQLYIGCIGSQDIEILGAIPTLLSLKLRTLGGTNGRITFHGKNGFRSLKHLFLCISACGTALEFEAGSMPKVEHLRLQLNAHEIDRCLNGGASSFGIQNLPTLTCVEVTIKGDYDAAESVASTIETAVETFPNRPTINVSRRRWWICLPYKWKILAQLHKDDGAPTDSEDDGAPTDTEEDEAPTNSANEITDDNLEAAKMGMFALLLDGDSDNDMSKCVVESGSTP